MTDTTDSVIGAIPGLMAVGIMANVAGKTMNQFSGPRRHQKTMRKQKHSYNLKSSNKSIW